MTTQSSYSASMPKAPFVLNETRAVARLMLVHDSRSTVREIVHSENLLGVKSPGNEKKLFDYIYNRMELLPDELKQVIVDGIDTDSRYVNLISIMAYDRLFMEFVFEVYRTKMSNGDPITDYDVMSFFERVASRSPRVAGWKYDTVFNLRRLYTRILYEAGLLKTSSGCREITKPFVSGQTMDLLRKFGFDSYVEATLGSS